jgi:hypothetical protein
MTCWIDIDTIGQDGRIIQPHSNHLPTAPLPGFDPLRLIGLNPFASLPVPLKLATFDPKNPPIPAPIPPRVAFISVTAGTLLAIGAGEVPAVFLASNRVLTSFRTPSNALNSDAEPVANAEDKASLVGASCVSNLRSCIPSKLDQVIPRRPGFTYPLISTQYRIRSLPYPHKGVYAHQHNACIIPSCPHLGSQRSKRTGSVTSCHIPPAVLSVEAFNQASPNGANTLDSPPNKA